MSTEFRREDYVTPRQRRQDGTQWQSSPPPLRGWAYEIWRALGFLIVIAGAWWAWARLAAWCAAVACS